MTTLTKKEITTIANKFKSRGGSKGFFNRHNTAVTKVKPTVMKKQTIALTADDHRALKVMGYLQEVEYTRSVKDVTSDNSGVLIGTASMFKQQVKVTKYTDDNFWLVV